ncbi:MAG: hypothetical protein M1832_004760 [Thelocarpon impressellum]|nr:MAG: hypothetical protein M1832_004760 [Thelocarpon impressellum]
MAAPVTSLPLVKLPAGPAPRTPEQTYWTTFRSHQQIPSPSNFPVTHISHSPPSAGGGSKNEDLFAVTTGLRVQLYSVRTRKLVKTISRFDDTAHSGELRRDGRVLVAGDDTGAIQVFDVSSRAILKTWKEHKQAVWTMRFSPVESTRMMSASDDKTVRLWDLPSQEAITTFAGHGDYVRAGAFMPTSTFILSGSYDETVRLWDPRSPGRSAMTFKHSAPVECVLPLPSGTTVLAAAGSQISVLDLVAGKPLALLKNHQKTVTSLSLASHDSRLVSGGLDGHMKVFETTGWNVVSGSKYPSPILSLAVIPGGASQDDKHLAVGMHSGTLSIRTRLSGAQKTRERERAREMAALVAGTIDAHDRAKEKKRPQGWRHRFRGQDFRGEGADILISDTVSAKAHRRKEAAWQKLLRKGRYGPALDAVLGPDTPHPPLTVLTLLRALAHRSALRAALADRDSSTLQPLLKWLAKHIQDPRFVVTAADVALLLLEMYSGKLGQPGTGEVEALVRRLHASVTREVEAAQVAVQTGGMLGLLGAG